MHDKFNKHGNNPIIEFSREDIAQYVGTTTKSLIRTLSDFKSERLIEIKSGKISIINLENLKTCCTSSLINYYAFLLFILHP
ncbi:MAG: helix-turn-helix domain-containing protein [Chitinophagaceae bacterium]